MAGDLMGREIRARCNGLAEPHRSTEILELEKPSGTKVSLVSLSYGHPPRVAER